MTFLEGMGTRIRQARELRGFTQQGLGINAGYGEGSAKVMISLIESGKRDIPASKIIAIADALRVSPSYLMGWDDLMQRGG